MPKLPQCFEIKLKSSTPKSQPQSSHPIGDLKNGSTKRTTATVRGTRSSQRAFQGNRKQTGCQLRTQSRPVGQFGTVRFPRNHFINSYITQRATIIYTTSLSAAKEGRPTTKKTASNIAERVEINKQQDNNKAHGDSTESNRPDERAFRRKQKIYRN